MRIPSKNSNILAAVIWILSIILAFKIQPASKFIWLPDTLLLLGFFPLFISIRSAWLWFIFGLINIFVGLMLLIILYAPKEELARLEQLCHFHVIEMNAHVQSYHPYYVWAIIGVLSTIIGLVQMLIRVIRWLYACLTKPKQLP